MGLAKLPKTEGQIFFETQIARLEKVWPNIFNQPERKRAMYLWVKDLSGTWLKKLITNLIGTSTKPPLLEFKNAADEERKRIRSLDVQKQRETTRKSLSNWATKAPKAFKEKFGLKDKKPDMAPMSEEEIKAQTKKQLAKMEQQNASVSKTEESGQSKVTKKPYNEKLRGMSSKSRASVSSDRSASHKDSRVGGS